MTAIDEIRNKLVPIRRTGWQEKSFVSLGFEAEEDYLRSVIGQVVNGNVDGIKVSTSIMVYGSSGCGKSQLVDKVIKSIQDQLGGETFDLVHLDGTFCFSLQDSVTEICNQLLDGELDPLEEITMSDTMPFDEKLEGMLSYLRNKLMESRKSLVFVIDGMDKFVDDSNQRLLYNLFDISANAAFSVPICIVGITTCVDILDSFEKRVRSRFSHRQINLIPKIEFPQYLACAEGLLSHSKNKEWNNDVQTVLGDKEVIKIIRSLYEADKSIGQLKRFLYVATLICEDKFAVSNVRDAYAQLFGIQCQVQIVMDLPQSELVVLLGIYKKIQRSQQAWQPSEIYEIVRKPYSLFQLRKEDFMKTILKFRNLELIVPVGGSQHHKCLSNISESYFKCEISYVEFQEIWKKYPNLPSFFNEFL